MFKKAFFIVISCLVFAFVLTSSTFAQMPGNLSFKDSYIQGKIVSILSQKMQTTDGQKNLYQKFKVHLLSGNKKGETVIIDLSSDTKTP